MKLKKYLVFIFSTLSLLIFTACGTQADDNTVRVGVVGDVSAEIWNDIADRLQEKKGINLEVVTFTDYVQPNRALAEGELELNAFQHSAYLRDYRSETDSDIVPASYTLISPTFVFGTDEIPDIESIPNGATIAISNITSVQNRGLLALENMGLIEVDDAAGYTPTINDITANLKNIELVQMESSQVPRALGDADLIVTGADYAANAGFDLNDAIYQDTNNMDSVDPTKKNVIAVKRENLDNETLQAIINEYQTSETAKKLTEISDGGYIPAWTENDTPTEDFDQLINQNSE